jgi:predicted nucleotidyltransferase
MVALIEEKQTALAELCSRYRVDRLFGRPVDLVTEQSIRNPYFRREVESTRQLIYERPDE